MNRKDIESQYTVVDGKITSPGKFEGEFVFAPFIYDIWMLDGNIDKGELIQVTDDMTDEFPELVGWDNGFYDWITSQLTQIHCKTFQNEPAGW